MKKIMFLADIIVLAAFAFGLFGYLVKAVKQPTPAPVDPNVIVLSKAEVAIVRAINVKCKQLDAVQAQQQAQIDVIRQAMTLSDPNMAL